MAKYICCATREETRIVGKYSGGRLVPIQTGFPRHDSLLEKLKERVSKTKRIFITFHWRTGEYDFSRKSFSESQYLKDVNQLLNSEEIKRLSESGEAEVMFFPHARFVKYLSLFKVPSHVKIPESMQFQDMLVDSDVLVTDFSSNSFEMAYMGKPTIVYVPGLKYVR